MSAFQSGEFSQLQEFDGKCSFGTNYRDFMYEESPDIDVITVQNCYDQCKVTDGCTAFDYDANVMDCDLYSGGPYTYGDRNANLNRENKKCYTMSKGCST